MCLSRSGDDCETAKRYTFKAAHAFHPKSSKGKQKKSQHPHALNPASELAITNQISYQGTRHVTKGADCTQNDRLQKVLQLENFYGTLSSWNASRRVCY